MRDQPQTPDRETLTKLRQEGMTRDEIAAYYGVTLARVKRWISDLEVPTPRIKKAKKSETPPLDMDDGLTLIERAQRILGRRMGEDYRGYLLDGRPVRVDILIQSAGLKVGKLA